VALFVPLALGLKAKPPRERAAIASMLVGSSLWFLPSAAVSCVGFAAISSAAALEKPARVLTVLTVPVLTPNW